MSNYPAYRPTDSPPLTYRPKPLIPSFVVGMLFGDWTLIASRLRDLCSLLDPCNRIMASNKKDSEKTVDASRFVPPTHPFAAGTSTRSEDMTRSCTLTPAGTFHVASVFPIHSPFCMSSMARQNPKWIPVQFSPGSFHVLQGRSPKLILVVLGIY